MNNEEEAFLAEMADMEQDLPSLSEEELLRLHTRTLKKAGLKKKPARPALRVCKWVAAAAVMTFALLGAGATCFKVSDLFRDFLGPSDTPVLTSLSPQRNADDGAGAAAYRMPEAAYNETAGDMGALLENTPKTETVSGVTMKAEGLLGDADTLLLLLSAESDAGILTGDLQLGEVWLTSTSEDGTVHEQRLCDIQSLPSDGGATARFLVKDKLTQDVAGRPITLTVRNVTRFENSRGEALPLRRQNLYDFWKELEDSRLNRFEYSGSQAFLLGDAGGVPLLESDDSLMICAMGLQNGVFYFNIAEDGTSDGPPMENLALKNKTTGALLTSFTAISGTQDHYFYRFEIPGVEHVEDLQNYTLVKNGGWCRVMAAEGEWIFDITPEYRNLSKTILIEQDAETPQGTFHFDTLTVSPISISLTGSVPFEPDFSALIQTPRLRMADGSFVALDSMQGSYTADTGAFTLEFILPRMIEPEKLTGLEGNGLSLTFVG